MLIGIRFDAAITALLVSSPSTAGALAADVVHRKDVRMIQHPATLVVTDTAIIAGREVAAGLL